MQAQSWLQLDVRCWSHQTESVGEALIQAGSLGLEERLLPPEDALSKGSWDALLIVYFDAQMTEAQRKEVLAALADLSVHEEQLCWSMHRDDGWSTRWKEFFRPLPIGERFLICPTWEEVPPTEEGRMLIRLDPGMAFGTGHHATTRTCLRFLEEYVQPQQVLLDVGCGSGILSLGALLLGAAKAVGVDIDPDAITVAKENAERNNLLDRCDFSTTDLNRLKQTFPLVIANIQAHILNPMAPALKARLAPKGILILSGILGDQSSRVRVIFEQTGLHFLKQTQDEEWVTMALSLPSSN